MKLNSRHRQQHRRLELSMTSMIDVVFLLLIFFLVTTTFVRPERQLLSAIQSNEREAAKKESVLEPAMVDVQKVGGDVVFRIGAIKTDSLAEVKRVMQGFENKSEGAWVRVADNVPFEYAAQAVGACRAAGFSAVAWLPAE
jgi:biopolymer transport protein ExbD